jgi:TRAP-type C4-dicarboxylate transport system permease large subunit
LSYLRIPALLAEGIFFISENKLFVLLAINVPLLILGMLMDMGVLILLPIVSKVRVDPIHFGG